MISLGVIATGLVDGGGDIPIPPEYTENSFFLAINNTNIGGNTAWGFNLAQDSGFVTSWVGIFPQYLLYQIYAHDLGGANKYVIVLSFVADQDFIFLLRSDLFGLDLLGADATFSVDGSNSKWEWDVTGLAGYNTESSDNITFYTLNEEEST